MFLNDSIRNHLRLRRFAGEYGVEIEMEGNPRVRNLPGWNVETDGSLRGQDSREYVLSGEHTKAEAQQAVRNLYSEIQRIDGRISVSMRAGVHIHMNCQEMTIRQLLTMLAVYYCFEDVINLRFGPERQGNLFCLRLSDADYLNRVIQRAIQDRALAHFATDQIRYAAANLVALSKFGSLEFRAMQTTTEPEPINDWIDILDRIRESSLEFEGPMQVLEAFSADGWEELAQRIFGPHAETIINAPGAQELCENGVRRIQFWVFTTNWEND